MIESANKDTASKGFLYIATDDEYIRQAEISAKNTKRYMDFPITLVAHREVESEYFDTIIVDGDPIDSYGDKPRNLPKSPYDHTVYLDTDVFLLEPVPQLFNILRRKEIATTIDPTEFELHFEDSYTFEDVPDSVPIYQTGVIAYTQSDNVENLFEEWNRVQSIEDIERDQTSFRAAIYRTNINHLVISGNYNCLVNSSIQIVGGVKIIHDAGGSLTATLNDLSAIDRFSRLVNEYDGLRLLFGRKRGRIYSPSSIYANALLKYISLILVLSYRFQTLSYYAFNSFVNDGFVDTVRKVFKKITD